MITNKLRSPSILITKLPQIHITVIHQSHLLYSLPRGFPDSSLYIYLSSPASAMSSPPQRQRCQYPNNTIRSYVSLLQSSPMCSRKTLLRCDAVQSGRNLTTSWRNCHHHFKGRTSRYHSKISIKF